MSTVVITGASRSGSTFFGDLMRHAENVEARHEQIGGRDFFCVSAYAPMHGFIRRDVDAGLRALKAAADAAGKPLAIDVNSNVAFAVEALRAADPEIRLFHLVRDGRKVIASNWLRKMYTDYAKGVDVRPSSLSELAAWDGFDRFQKLAWQWNHIANELITQGVPSVRLERALEDYDYLAQHLLVPAGIKLPKATWEARRATRVNESRFKLKDLLRGRPTELEWTPAREAQFQVQCGASMAVLGYD